MSDAPADRPELVRYRVEDRVATVTLDSPHNRNALSSRLVGQLDAALVRADRDGEVRVVLLEASGPAFCSGADLGEALEVGMERTARDMVALQRRIVTLTKPVVARVHGAVRAGGIGLVAACDVAVCAADATFAVTEVRLGLAPAVISLTVLPRLTSRAAALTCLGGEPFDGLAAQRHGLVTTAVADDLDAAVSAACAELARGSLQGLAETKRLLNEPLVARVDALGADLAQRSARLFASDEARAAMARFLAR